MNQRGCRLEHVLLTGLFPIHQNDSLRFIQPDVTNGIRTTVNKCPSRMPAQDAHCTLPTLPPLARDQNRAAILRRSHPEYHLLIAALTRRVSTPAAITLQTHSSPHIHWQHVRPGPPRQDKQTSRGAHQDGAVTDRTPTSGRSGDGPYTHTPKRAAPVGVGARSGQRITTGDSHHPTMVGNDITDGHGSARKIVLPITC